MAYTVRYIDFDSGSDANTGGSGDPYVTIAKALGDLPSSGGLELNMTGSATGVSTLDFNASGNTVGATNPIIFKDWDGQTRPSIQMAASTAFCDTTAGRHSWCLQNIDFTWAGAGAPTDCLGTAGNDYIDICGCTFDGGGAGNFNFGLGGCMDSCYINDFSGTTINMDETGCQFINNYLDMGSGVGNGVIVATYGTAVNNIISHKHTSGFGIRFNTNQARIFHNVVYTSATQTSGFGIGGLAVENNAVVCDNYVENFYNNYNLTSSYSKCFRNNVAVNGVNNDYLNILTTQNASNLALTESWLTETGGFIGIRHDRWNWHKVNENGSGLYHLPTYDLWVAIESYKRKKNMAV